MGLLIKTCFIQSLIIFPVNVILKKLPLTNILKGYKYSTIPGISIVKTIFTLWLKYNLIPVFCKDREEMQNFIIHYYWAEWRKIKANKGLRKVYGKYGNVFDVVPIR